MTMTNEEICREYRQAKAPTKQIQILADLNGCKKDEIKQILIDGGEKLPGNMTAPGERKAPKPKAEPKPKTEPEPEKQTEEYIPVRDALPLLIGCAAAHVINSRAAEMSEADVTEMMDFCQFAKGVMALLEEVERRCKQ